MWSMNEGYWCINWMCKIIVKGLYNMYVIFVKFDFSYVLYVD